MTLLHLQLFWGENQDTFLALDSLPELSSRQEKELKSWTDKRRKILRHEAYTQPWVIVGTDGYSAEITLKPNGNAEEAPLFKSGRSNGRWKIQDGILLILFTDGGPVTEYRILGNSESNIHSGARYRNGLPHGLVKVVQVKPE